MPFIESIARWAAFGSINSMKQKPFERPGYSYDKPHTDNMVKMKSDSCMKQLEYVRGLVN